MKTMERNAFLRVCSINVPYELEPQSRNPAIVPCHP